MILTHKQTCLLVLLSSNSSWARIFLKFLNPGMSPKTLIGSPSLAKMMTHTIFGDTVFLEEVQKPYWLALLQIHTIQPRLDAHDYWVILPVISFELCIAFLTAAAPDIFHSQISKLTLCSHPFTLSRQPILLRRLKPSNLILQFPSSIP